MGKSFSLADKDKAHARLATHIKLIIQFSRISTHRHQPANLSKPSQHQQAGGANETRTRDPLLAKQVLSQLSYSPILRESLSSAMDGGPR
jgi:hypothetical protein